MNKPDLRHLVKVETHPSAVSGVPFIESLEVDKLHLIVTSLLCCIQLTSAHQHNVVTQVPLTIPVNIGTLTKYFYTN